MIEANENEDYLDATDEQYWLILALLDRALMSDEEKDLIKVSLYTQEEADKLIQRLTGNQIDPITAGLNYNQTDISRKLRKEI